MVPQVALLLLVELIDAIPSPAVERRRGRPPTYPDRLFDRWLEDVVKMKNRRLTHVAYKSKIALHIKPALGTTLLIKLTPDDVQRFLNAKSEAGLSPRMVRELRGVLRTALNRAMKWGLVLRNVAALTDPPRVEDTTVTVLTPEQARALLDAARGDRLEALYTVALAVGLRRGEALGLGWQDVDFENGVLHVGAGGAHLVGAGP